MRSAKNSNLTWVSCSARDNKIVHAAQGIPPLIPLFKGFGEGSFKMFSLSKVCWRFTRDWRSLQPKSSGSWWLYGEKTKALETLTLPMKTKAAKTTFCLILQKFFLQELICRLESWNCVLLSFVWGWQLVQLTEKSTANNKTFLICFPPLLPPPFPISQVVGGRNLLLKTGKNRGPEQSVFDRQFFPIE